MEAKVSRELERLAEYLRESRGTESTVQASSIAYVGGALTTLFHLGLLEFETFQRALARIPSLLEEDPGEGLRGFVD